MRSVKRGLSGLAMVLGLLVAGGVVVAAGGQAPGATSPGAAVVQIDPGDPPLDGVRKPGLQEPYAAPPIPWKVWMAGCENADRDGDGACVEEDRWCCFLAYYPQPVKLDCNDTDPVVFEGAPEACDGVDTDCDGFVDEGCAPVADLPHMTESLPTWGSDSGMMPSIAWNNEGYGVAWVEKVGGNAELLFARVAADGDPIDTTPHMISQRAGASETDWWVSLIWNGEEYGAVWQATDHILFARIDRDGHRIGEVEFVSEALPVFVSVLPSLAWSGSYWAAAWRQGTAGGPADEIYFGYRYERRGAGHWSRRPVEPDTSEAANGHPQILWTRGNGASEDGFALLWHTNLVTTQNLRYAVVKPVDRSGDYGIKRIVDPKNVALGVAGGGNGSPTGLVDTGERMVAVYAAADDPNNAILRATAFDRGDPEVGPSIDLGRLDQVHYDRVSLVWDGTYAVAAWAGEGRRLTLAGVSADPLSIVDLPADEPDGVDDDRYVLDIAEKGWRPALAWSGYELALIFDDGNGLPEGGPGLMLALVRSYADLDGDGYCLYASYGDGGGGGTGTEVGGFYGLTPGDVDEGEAGVNPLMSDICDGIDNDGDGALDPGCWQAGSGSLEGPKADTLCTPGLDCDAGGIEWSGDLFGAVIREDANLDGIPELVRFGTFDAQGNPVGTPVELNPGAPPFAGGGSTRVRPRIAWGGSRVGFGVIWADPAGQEDQDEELFFARLAETSPGQFEVAETGRVSVAPGWIRDLDLIWDGETFDAVWVGNTSPPYSHNVYFARINEHGQMLGRPRRVSAWDYPVFSELSYSRWPENTIPEHPQLTMDPLFGVVWQHYDGKYDREITYATMNATGDLEVSFLLTDTPVWELRPTIEYDGMGSFSVVWASSRRGSLELFMQQVSPLGFDGWYRPDAGVYSWCAPDEYPCPIVSQGLGYAADNPRLSGPLDTGSGPFPHLGLTYNATGVGTSTWEIYDLLVDADGRRPGGCQCSRDSLNGGVSHWPELDWNGEAFGVFWTDETDPPMGLAVSCPWHPAP